MYFRVRVIVTFMQILTLIQWRAVNCNDHEHPLVRLNSQFAPDHTATQAIRASLCHGHWTTSLT